MGEIPLDNRSDNAIETLGISRYSLVGPAGMLALKRTVEARRAKVDYTKKQLIHLEKISRGLSSEEVASEVGIGLEGAKGIRRAIRIKTPNQSITRAVFESILIGEILFEPELPGRVSLTERQREVADMICLGETNRVIAANLGLGEETVKTHVAHLLEALGASNRYHIPRRLFEAGIYLRPYVEPGDSAVINIRHFRPE